MLDWGGMNWLKLTDHELTSPYIISVNDNYTALGLSSCKKLSWELIHPKHDRYLWHNSQVVDWQPSVKTPPDTIFSVYCLQSLEATTIKQNTKQCTAWAMRNEPQPQGVEFMICNGLQEMSEYLLRAIIYKHGIYKCRIYFT